MMKLNGEGGVEGREKNVRVRGLGHRSVPETHLFSHVRNIQRWIETIRSK